MRLAWIWPVLALGVYAQSSTSHSVRPSTTPNSTRNVITTTITSIIPSASGRNATTSLLTLTLTLNTTSLEGNHTLSNGTVIAANGTILSNGTTNGTVWKEGDDWIPFHIVIDPAYGVLGALFILSGIPVAVLGGKNRWSSIAICSGYALMLFTLVLILRFGVQPSLQPPSPSPPTTSMRGLYLLACIISSFIGAGLGIFTYKFAKYCVSAAGGFTFAWFLLATKSGGLIDSVLGRWCLFGGLSVAVFIAGLPSKLTDIMMLISTAWIGATTFTLGIDCYTRAGLKEFYVYNLGFHSLFPKLDGAKYPLTQTMQIELGILAAIVLVGAAIQTRVLNRLKKKMREIREEEEMRIEAEEVSKAAERFKNVGSELAEWEEKHGTGQTDGSTIAATLEKESPESNTVALPPLNMERANSGYRAVALESPALVQSRTPSTAWHSVEELVGPEDDLSTKMKLLEEVRRARESIQGSLEDLRRAPTPSVRSRRNSTASTQILDDTPMTRAPSRVSINDTGMTREPSRVSMLDRPRPGSELPSPGPTRPGSTTSLLDLRPVSLLDTANTSKMTREPSRASILDRTRLGTDFTSPTVSITPKTRPGSTTSLLDLRPMSQPDTSHSVKSPTLSVQSDWDKYKSSRSIQAAPERQSIISGEFGKLPRNTSTQSCTSQRAELDRIAMPPPPAPMRRSASAQPNFDTEVLAEPWGPGHITGSAANSVPKRTSKLPRTMTYEELSERHRKRLSELQNPITSAMTQKLEAAEAREKWERQQKAEREEMRRREAEKREQRHSRRESRDVMKSTAEWRNSVHSGLDQRAQPKRTSSYSLVN